MVDIALIVVACVVPFVLIFFNLVLMGRYLDATATKGHYFAKLMIVRCHGRVEQLPQCVKAFVLSTLGFTQSWRYYTLAGSAYFHFTPILFAASWDVTGRVYNFVASVRCGTFLCPTPSGLCTHYFTRTVNCPPATLHKCVHMSIVAGQPWRFSGLWLLEYGLWWLESGGCVADHLLYHIWAGCPRLPLFHLFLRG